MYNAGGFDSVVLSVCAGKSQKYHEALSLWEEKAANNKEIGGLLTSQLPSNLVYLVAVMQLIWRLDYWLNLCWPIFKEFQWLDLNIWHLESNCSNDHPPFCLWWATWQCLVGWLVGWLNRFIYKANIARAPKLESLTGYPWTVFYSWLWSFKSCLHNNGTIFHYVPL